MKIWMDVDDKVDGKIGWKNWMDKLDEIF